MIVAVPSSWTGTLPATPTTTATRSLVARLWFLRAFTSELKIKVRLGGPPSRPAQPQDVPAGSPSQRHLVPRAERRRRPTPGHWDQEQRPDARGNVCSLSLGALLTTRVQSAGAAGIGYERLHVVDAEHALGDVQAVQQPLVRLALRVSQVGLEALLGLEGHDVHLGERVASAESSVEAPAVMREQREDGGLVRLEARLGSTRMSATMTMVKFMAGR